MKHPDGSCLRCGERLFGRADGGYACYNCNARYLLEAGPGFDGESSTPGSGHRDPDTTDQPIDDRSSITR